MENLHVQHLDFLTVRVCIVVLIAVAPTTTILVVSLDSGTTRSLGGVDGGARSEARRGGEYLEQTRRHANDAKKNFNLPKQVRGLALHVPASKTARFPSKLQACLIKEWLVRECMVRPTVWELMAACRCRAQR